MTNNGRFACGLLYTNEGNEIYHFRKGDLVAKPHSLVFIPQGERYTIDLTDPQSDVTVMNFTLPDFEPPAPFRLLLPPTNAIGPLFSEAEQLWKRKTTAYYADSMAILYRVLAFATRQWESFSHYSHYQKLETALHYLQEHYTDPDFRITHAQAQCGFSSKYFRSLFIEQFRMSPKEYVTALRLQRAKELLAEGRDSVTEIAALCGYTDLYHFSKLFRAKEGCSPLAYRKQLLQAGRKEAML